MTKTLEVYVFGAYMYPNNNVPADSIWGHPAVPDAIAVAAANQSTPSTIEDFSSQGPVTIAFPVAESRPKPDITGVDGVSVTGAGGFHNPFYGTSASAPHVAAVVAQIWGAHPELTPTQVRSALYSSAVHVGTPGKNTVFGYGRADALAMAGLTLPAVTPFPDNSDGPASLVSKTDISRTETVNVGGGSAVTRATMTGTGLGKNLVITAMPRTTLPATIAAPLTTVYQYLSITSSTITGVVSQTTLEFTIPQSWLTEHGFEPGDIVMMHYVDGKWQTLNTEFISRNDGNVFYRAITPGFSYFAIAYEKGGTLGGATTPIPTPLVVTTDSVTLAPVPGSPPPHGVIVRQETKTPPPAPIVVPEEGIPFTIIIAGVFGALVIIISAFLVRRWWIRRQNPALFREYD